MRLYRENIPTWQRMALQLTVAIGLGSSILYLSELAGSDASSQEPAQPRPAGHQATRLIAENITTAVSAPDMPAHTSRAPLYGTIAAAAAISSGLLMPGLRRRRISDDLTDARQREHADRGGSMPARLNLSGVDFASDRDAALVVAGEIPADTTTYVAASYAEHHQIPDSEPSVHPIRAIKNWLAHRHEIIAQQTSPDTYVYDGLRPPLNAIEPISLTA